MPDDDKGEKPEEATSNTTTTATSGNATFTTTADPTKGMVPVGELADERQKRHKAEEALKKATDAAEREKLSEKERLEAERDEARGEASAAKLDALRVRVGAKKGLPDELIGRLEGETKAEMEKDADRLVKALGQAGGGFDGGVRRPQEEADMNTLIRRAAGRI